MGKVILPGSGVTIASQIEPDSVAFRTTSPAASERAVSLKFSGSQVRTVKPGAVGLERQGDT